MRRSETPPEAAERASRAGWGAGAFSPGFVCGVALMIAGRVFGW